MSNGSLDYQKLCSNYYSSYEDGCCMESCEFYNHNECPVVYVNGLLEKKDEEIALTEKSLKIAVNIANQKSAHLWTIEEIKTKAKEMMKSE